jgi:hypothetical protein
LRRLVGIGPVNERRLNEHGITTFAQIAAWTAADINKAEEYLQFDGRIERERWVAQAKLLAVGDEKEFARRFSKAARSPLFARSGGACFNINGISGRRGSRGCPSPCRTRVRLTAPF